MNADSLDGESTPTPVTELPPLQHPQPLQTQAPSEMVEPPPEETKQQRQRRKFRETIERKRQAKAALLAKRQEAREKRAAAQSVQVEAPTPPAAQPEATHACLKNLHPHARKAEAWHLHTPEQPMFETRCRECNGIMWTWSEREDICETCGFELREKRAELRKARDAQGQRTNPFQHQPQTHVKVGVEKAGRSQVNPTQSQQSKPHQVGITTTKRFHNPFAR